MFGKNPTVSITSDVSMGYVLHHTCADICHHGNVCMYVCIIAECIICEN